MVKTSFRFASVLLISTFMLTSCSNNGGDNPTNNNENNTPTHEHTFSSRMNMMTLITGILQVVVMMCKIKKLNTHLLHQKPCQQTKIKRI